MGILIDLEGLDGSGKSTQMSLLCRRLDTEQIDYRKIKLPDYDSESSILVRKYLAGDFGAKAGDVNAYAASAFFAVDRVASFAEKWRTDYENGRLILADRYTPANAVYQAAKLEENLWEPFLSWLFDFEYVRLALPKPNRVIFLDMPIEISQQLLTARYHGDESKKDVHESDPAFLHRCRKAALFAAEKYGWHLLNCAENGSPLPPDVIHEKIFSAVKEVLYARF